MRASGKRVVAPSPAPSDLPGDVARPGGASQNGAAAPADCVEEAGDRLHLAEGRVGAQQVVGQFDVVERHGAARRRVERPETWSATSVANRGLTCVDQPSVASVGKVG